MAGWDAWDEAQAKWAQLVNEGQAVLAGVIHARQSLTHLRPDGPAAALTSAICAGAGAAKVYSRLVRRHGELELVVRRLELVAEDLADAAAKLERSGLPTMLTHDAQSLTAELHEVVALYQAQVGVCRGVAAAVAPGATAAVPPRVVAVTASLWLMQPKLPAHRLAHLDRLRRTELDRHARAALLRSP